MKKNRHIFFKLLPSFLLFVSLVIVSQQCPAQEKRNKTETAKLPTKESIVSLLKDDSFEYTIEDRNDPFLPFLTEEKKPEVDMNEIVDVDGELTGMQLFEPGQLTLVAIVQSGSKQFAMAQDFTGKGYILTKGIKIGKRGIITDIIPNQVIIEETAYTRAGKKLTNEIIMYLKQEGEEL